jgi:two-component system cell cycle sensor histidine kinase/response regulator CckA
MRPADYFDASDEPLERLVRLAARMLDVPVAALARREGADLCLAAAHGVDGGERAALEAVIRVAAAEGNPAAAAERAGLAAWTAVPVGAGAGGSAGLLLVADRKPRVWAEAEVQQLADIGTIAADALRRSSERVREAELRQSQRIESVVQLAGGIAHDFNNLLTTILGSAEILLEDPGLGAESREDVEEIRKAATRGAQLTHQLLAFSRRQVLLPQLLDLNDIVDDMGRLLRRVIGEAVELEVELAPTLEPVLADRAQLEQAILDLALRARDAMPHGGRLRLSTVPIEIDDRRASAGLRPGRYTALEIRDSGPALNRETLDRVFEPFGPAGQSGLGLASMHGVMRQSGGYVMATSEPGRGTTFTILLAAVEHQAAAQGAPPPSTAEHGETILLVEDELPVRKLAQRVLERAGYSVVVAAEAQSAVALANRYPGPIHLLVADMMLPGLSGRELAAQLTIHRPAIKVIYISGTTDDAIARHRVLAPGTEFLQKPFALGQLLQKVRKVLDAPPARS